MILKGNWTFWLMHCSVAHRQRVLVISATVHASQGCVHIVTNNLKLQWFLHEALSHSNVVHYESVRLDGRFIRLATRLRTFKECHCIFLSEGDKLGVLHWTFNIAGLQDKPGLPVKVLSEKFLKNLIIIKQEWKLYKQNNNNIYGGGSSSSSNNNNNNHHHVMYQKKVDM
jgi:hypothetical protein